MNADSENPSRALLKNAYTAIQKLQGQLRSVEQARHAPIAIVGMACRFPGGNDPEAFWQFLVQGGDAVRDVPAERWDLGDWYDPDRAAPGKTYCQVGAFLDQAEQFDASLFGIAPREAATLDPQQGLLLETAWEAFEDAGLASERLEGSATGVFVGLCNNDYARVVLERGDQAIDAYAATGTSPSVAAGRLSYVFGLRGPCLTIDTACSSSLVALHQACQALRAGECAQALAGAVNLMFDPRTHVVHSKAQMLSASGRCRTFDAGADGYVRGEGCGVLILKRLDDALAEGDRVLAVVRGSAVNQDGHSSGLTAPNGPSQQAVIRAALADAGIDPATVDYVEAHGTGTALGDPIEVDALNAVYGPGRKQPLWIGSVKTNIGHLEAAAGIAGVIKVCLALRHDRLPPHLHLEQPNPHIPWTRLALQVCQSGADWPKPETQPDQKSPRRAGVSAFAFSGTNAHIVLEEAPPRAEPTQLAGAERTCHVLCLAAAKPAALRELAARYVEWIEARPALDLADFAYSANTGRSHLDHRAAIPFSSRETLLQRLRQLASGEVEEPTQARATQAPRIAFLFTGQGAQYAGMGRRLYQTQPVFRAAIDQAAEALQLPRSLIEVLFQPGEALNQTGYTQPALFAIETALTALWKSWGIEPQVLIGHSVGEFAAACAAGIHAPEAGLRLIAERGRLMQSLPAGGAMAAIPAGPDQVLPHIEKTVSLAADNGPQTVIAGPVTAVDLTLTRLQKAGMSGQKLAVSHAFHSALMEPILEPLARFAADIEARRPERVLIANLNGRPLESGQTLDAAYWRRHAREPVRFGAGVRALAEQDVDVLVEIGPSPVLTTLALRAWPTEVKTPLTLASLRPGRADDELVAEALAALYLHGARIDWAAWDRPWPRRRLALPGYPFQRVPYLHDGPRVPSQPRLQSNLTQSTDGLCYELAWQALAPLVAADSDIPGHWLILSDADDLTDALLARHPGSQQIEPPSEPADWDTLLAAAPWAGVLFLATPGDGTPPEQGEALSRALLGLIQALIRWPADSGPAPRLRIVTRAAQSVAIGDTVAPDQTLLWGFGRGAISELPGLNTGLIDLPQRADLAAADLAVALWAQIHTSEDEDQVVLRGSDHGISRYAARLRPTTVETPPTGSTRIRPDGRYLISGGLGGLGLEIAQWLVDQGARSLLLLGRRAVPDGPATAAIRRMQDRGADIRLVPVDVTDRQALATALAAFAPLAGVIHAAGVGTTTPLDAMTPEALHEVLAAKVTGAWNLHTLTAAQPLDLFLCLSSVAAVWGGRGQTHYAAANAFLDGLVDYRRQRGLPGCAIDYGPWRAAGMLTAGARDWLERTGLRPLSPRRALAALGTLLDRTISKAVVVDLEWPRFLAVYQARRRSPLLSEIATDLDPGADTADDRATLEAVPAEERLDWVEKRVDKTLAEVLRIAPESLDPLAGFFDMGMDSLTAVEFAQALGHRVGRSLSNTLAMDHPNRSALTDYLLRTLFGDHKGRGQTVFTAAPDEAIAVIGLAGRFPGANDPDAYWRVLTEDVEAIGEVPADRWDIAAYFDPDPAKPGKMYTRHGGFLDQIDQFDAELFHITPREAEQLDPQQRLLLETAWEALHNAGLAPETLRGHRGGVYVGCGANEYGALAAQASAGSVDAYFSTGNALNAIAGRCAYVLGLQGPAVTLDTACSSSLVAVHQAVLGLRAGDCELALAGGVSLMVSPLATLAACRAHMLAPDGRCKSFDADADGYVRGEGCGVVVLKRLTDAKRDGDAILGVIRGSAVNHDGASSGLTVPNGPAQETLIREALARTGVAPAEIAYVEAHGTGTALGDPIEVQALGAVFGEGRQDGQALWIGSAKSRVGHLEAAAGMAGLIKVLLAMHHDRLPGQRHFHTPNPHIPWDALPLRVVERTMPWPEGRRLAGVSAFGFSGTNAHVVLEAFPVDGERAPIAPASPYPFKRRRYWIDPTPATQPLRPAPAPLLGERQVSALSGETVHQSLWDYATHPFIAEHQVYGERLVPGATYAAMAASSIGLPGCVLDLEFHEPMVFGDGEARLVQLVSAAPGTDGTAEFQLFSAAGSASGQWVRHARGRFKPLAGATPSDQAAPSPAELQARMQPAPAERVFSGLAEAGVTLGPRFRAIQALWRGNDEALGQLVAPQELAEYDTNLVLHPALLDACTQVVGAARERAESTLFVPWRYQRLELYGTLPPSFFCHARLHADTGLDGETASADLRFMDAAGHTLGLLEGFTLKRAPRELLLRAQRPQLDDLFYGLRWDEAPLPGPGFPDDPTLPAAITRVAPESVLPDGPVWADYRELVRALEPLALAWAVHGLRTLGWQPEPGDRVATAALAHRLDLDPRHQRLLGRLLQLLAKAGILAPDATGWTVLQPVAASDPTAVQRELEQHLAAVPPEGRHELDLLGRCGRQLAEILRGEVDPLGILFPEAGGGAEAIYRDGLGSQLLGRVVREVVAGAVAHLPDDRPLRVLEIGAGTGGTTGHILELLPPGSSYCYTDLSPAFFPAARERFAAYPWVNYRTLDIERDPGEQGLLPGSFDLVVAANVLHATRDLDQTLTHVAWLIAPGGLCLLLEGVQRRAWLDLTFGLLPGWWRFEDARRTDHPLFDRAAWSAALAAHGLSDMAATAIDGEDDEQAVMVARRSGEVIANADGWLIFADDTGVAESLTERLAGSDCVLATQGPEYLCSASGRYQLPAGDRAACSHLLGEIAASGRVLRHVVYLWGLDVEPAADAALADRVNAACNDLLAVAQALANEAPPSLLDFSIVTRGAMPVGVAPTLTQSALPGLGLGIATEHPELRCRRIDLDPATPADEADRLYAELSATDAEEQIALRGSQRKVARLTRMAPRPTSGATLRPDRTYLITGGLGGLGLELARWMVDHGARHLALIGRGAPTPAAELALQALREQGCEVQLGRGDVADETQMRELFDGFHRVLPPLAGIVHAAGQLRDAALVNQTAEGMAEVLAAKVGGAWNLHRLTEADELDFFVLFASSVGLLGSWGQANHAAANVFLDALAHHRRNLGLAASSIDWGPWSEVGAAARRGAENRMAGHGVSALSPGQGLAALERCLTEAPVQAAVIRVDWARLGDDLRHRARPPMLSDLLEPARDSDVGERSDHAKLPQRLMSLAPDEAKAELVGLIQRQVAQVLRLAPDARPDPGRGWFDLGMDSLVIVELHHWLQGQLGDACRLPSTLAFELPTIGDLARHVVDILTEPASRADEARQPVPEPVTGTPSDDDDLSGLSLDELAAQLDEQIAAASARTKGTP